MKIYLKTELTTAEFVKLGQVFRTFHSDYLLKVEPYDDMVLAYELRTGKQVKVEQAEQVEVYPDAVIVSRP